ncbi:MAG: GNAT family N-acetyltransferase [Pseudomonadota bacterium]|nr:GNAT family N-acetyltransferase [Pseudomonadota bacterium]
MAPPLETERLVLRRFETSDFDAHLAIMAEPEVHRHLGPPMSREDLWRRTIGGVGMWIVLGFGGWMVLRKDDGTLIGNVGFFDARRDLDPDFGGAPEMGWIFSAAARGQGLAREACDAALGWLDANLQPTPVWAIIEPSNEASFKLAARLGFERLSDSIYHDEPIAVLKRAARSV